MTIDWHRRVFYLLCSLTCVSVISCTELQQAIENSDSIGTQIDTWLEEFLDEPATFNGEPTELTVVGYNVESGGANPMVIAEQYVGSLAGVDVWGFSEVQNAEWLRLLEQGAELGEETDFRSILGQSGGGDRLAVVYDSSLLRLINYEELDALSFGGRVRAALITHFQVRTNGQEFLFVVNHLYRTKDDLRHEQAQMLNAWAQRQQLPIVAVGDYNFDFDVIDGDSGDRDRGFDLLTENDVFQWVRPDVLVKSYCSDRYNSILDFTFVGNQALTWPVKDSTILFASPDSDYCPDDEIKSDHRPVSTTFEVPPLGN
ncbi:MAG: endonuclease/exonuclease/phosphatase [Cyanobacteria bacterium J06627_8]